LFLQDSPDRAWPKLFQGCRRRRLLSQELGALTIDLLRLKRVSEADGYELYVPGGAKP